MKISTFGYYFDRHNRVVRCITSKLHNDAEQVIINISSSLKTRIPLKVITVAKI